VRFDPWQFARSAQTLAKLGLPMLEFPQSIPNLTAMTVNLYELLKGGNLEAYPDPGIRLAIQHAVTVETSRGLKLAKEKASHKIDVLVALAMAALGVVQNPQPAALTNAELDRLIEMGRGDTIVGSGPDSGPIVGDIWGKMF